MPEASPIDVFSTAVLVGLGGAVAVAIYRVIKMGLDFFALKLAEHIFLLAFGSVEVSTMVRRIVSEELNKRPLTNGVGWAAVKRIADHLGIDLADLEEKHRLEHVNDE